MSGDRARAGVQVARAEAVFGDMGIAWVDDSEPSAEERTLRLGGLPLLPPGTPWPLCPHCDLPLLFRAQVPLALTALVAFHDDRVLSVFECHAVFEDGQCHGGRVLVVGGVIEIVAPPRVNAFDLIITALGDEPLPSLCYLSALEGRPTRVRPMPWTVVHGVEEGFARDAKRRLEALGAAVRLHATTVTTLAGCRGGRLVALDDTDDADPKRRPSNGAGSSSLGALTRDRVRVHGLVGGVIGGAHRGAPCGCGRTMRPALKLFRHRAPDPHGPLLDETIVEVCTRCGAGDLVRADGHAARRASSH